MSQMNGSQAAVVWSSDAVSPPFEHILTPVIEVYRQVLPVIFRRVLSPALRSIVPGLAPPRRKLSKHQSAEISQLISEVKALTLAHEHTAGLQKVRRILRIDPWSQGALRQHVTILIGLGRLRAARRAARKLVFLHPLDTVGYRHMKSLGMPLPPRSMEIALGEIRRKQSTPAAYVQASNYLYEAELFDDDAALIRLGLQKTESLPQVSKTIRAAHNLLYNQGRNLESSHHFEDAIAIYRSLSETAFATSAAKSIVRCLHELGRDDEAYQSLLDLGGRPADWPFTTLTLEVSQAAGRIGEAYLLYRKRPISLAIAETFNQPVPTSISIKSGRYKDRQAMLISEGGPGDELRISSIYSEFANSFGALTITCEPRLHAAMARSFPQIRFLPVARLRREFARKSTDRSLIKDAFIYPSVSDVALLEGRKMDFVCSTLDALGEFRQTRADFALDQHSRLIPDAALKQKYALQTVGTRPQVGLTWRSMLLTVARNRHYLTAEQLRPLQALENVDFWILQPQATAEEIAYLSDIVSLKVPDFDLVDDFESQMALMANLDFVVSPFTTTGELAGAVGTPTLLLSTAGATVWRRNDDGSDVWHRSTRVIFGNPLHDKVSAIRNAANAISKQLGLSQQDAAE